MGGPMKNYVVLIIFLVLIVSAIQAVSAIPLITGTSSATLIDKGDYAGLYRYDIALSWKQIGNFNEINLPLNINLDQTQQIIFPEPAGYSLRDGMNDNVTAWIGTFVDNHNSSLFGCKDYIVFTAIFTPGHQNHGKTSSGTFSFYSDMAPQYVLDETVFIEHSGHKLKNYGDIKGDFPSETSIPEPATLVLLGFGAVPLLFRKRR